MTAPRWIAEAIDATYGDGVDICTSVDVDKIAAALIERLPIEAMAAAGCEAITTGTPGNPMAAAVAMVSAMVLVLAEGDPEVVQLTELYQGACKALDDAGVPYGAEGVDFDRPLDLAGRIRWLAQQRPTRLELQRVEAERDDAQNREAVLRERFAALKDIAAEAKARLEGRSK